MFTPDEVTALVLGARLVKAWGGTEMVSAAVAALARIEAVLPAELAARLDAIALYSPSFQMPAAHRRLLDRLHAACLSRTVIVFTYTRLADDASRAELRTVRPLALAFWSGVWTLAAWCETRNDFRSFRIDRMEGFTDTGTTFTPKRGQRLEDYLKRARSDAKAGAVTT
jgi:predicted DNA-binding transcriptional regulator YafY